MKTRLIDGKALHAFDGEIVSALKLSHSTAKAFRADRMTLGIRNEGGEIYRAIGVTGLDNFLEAIDSSRKIQHEAQSDQNTVVTRQAGIEWLALHWQCVLRRGHGGARV